MTIAITDIAATEQLAGHALTTVRGGYATMPAELPSQTCLPSFPGFPPGFPFNVGNPTVQPEGGLRLIDPQNPLLQ